MATILNRLKSATYKYALQINSLASNVHASGEISVFAVQNCCPPTGHKGKKQEKGVAD
ncbi:MAG: hypothetical protein ACJAUE_002423 [Alcanivorax sp.]|jgi:hypothetical protein